MGLSTVVVAGNAHGKSVAPSGYTSARQSGEIRGRYQCVCLPIGESNSSCVTSVNTKSGAIWRINYSCHKSRYRTICEYRSVRESSYLYAARPPCNSYRI